MFRLATIALLAAAATASPINIAERSPLCTPQYGVGFTLHTVSDDPTLNNKTVTMKGHTVGISQPAADYPAWPYIEANTRHMLMPAPGVKMSGPAFIAPVGFGGEALFMLPDTSVKPQTFLFDVACDINGSFFLASEWDWNWQACPRREGQGYSVSSPLPLFAF